MNEKTIWDFLIERIMNPYGTAALMGNLMAESSLNPLCATGKNKTVNYVADVDNGEIDFVNDGVAFGLAQWRYWSRKRDLLEYAKAHNASVGELDTQLGYLWEEIQKYKVVFPAIMEVTNIPEISDMIMLYYERPGDTSDKAKAKRANYAQSFYNSFVIEKENGATKVIATDNVRIRSGDGKEYAVVGSLRKGDSAEWVASVGEWYAIRMRDRVGWVSAEFARLE